MAEEPKVFEDILGLHEEQLIEAMVGRIDDPDITVRRSDLKSMIDLVGKLKSVIYRQRKRIIELEGGGNR